MSKKQPKTQPKTQGDKQLDKRSGKHKGGRGANADLVYGVLAQSDSPLGAYQILDAIPGLTAPVQIYRALDSLIREGKVHKIERKNAFICCCAEKPHHKAMTVLFLCNQCGQVEEITESDVEKTIKRLCRESRFHPRNELIEIEGRCDNCPP